MPPIGYPGNSITKEARAKAGGGFESAIEVAGSNWVEGQEPSIQSVSGTLAYGNTMSISGSNISSEVGVQTFYDDFSTGTLGNTITSFEDAEGASFKYVYDNTSPFSDGGRFARLSPVGATNFRNVFRLNNLASKELMVMMRFRVASTVSERRKYQTVLAGSDHTSHDQFSPRMGMFSVPGEGVFFAQSTEDAATGESHYTLDPDNNGWVFVAQYLKLDSTPGAGDGKRFAKTGQTPSPDNGSQDIPFNDPDNDGSIVPWAWDSDDVVTLSVTSSRDTLEQFWLPWYGYDLIYDVSNVWVSKSREAVFLSPEATWTAAVSTSAGLSKLAHQKMTARSNDSLSFSADLGADLQTGPVYAYVMNHDGLTNENGFQLRAS